MIILTFLTGIDGTVGAFKACLADVGTSIIMHGYLVTSSVLQKLGWRWLILQTTYISCTSRCSVAVASSDKKWNVFLRKIIFTPRFPSVHSFHSVFPFFGDVMRCRIWIMRSNWRSWRKLTMSWKDAMENLLEHVFRNVLGVEQEDLDACSATVSFWLEMMTCCVTKKIQRVESYTQIVMIYLSIFSGFTILWKSIMKWIEMLDVWLAAVCDWR